MKDLNPTRFLPLVLIAVLLVNAIGASDAWASDKPHPEYSIDNPQGLKITVDPRDYCPDDRATIEYRRPGDHGWRTAAPDSFYAFTYTELESHCIAKAGASRESRVGPEVEACIVCQGQSERQTIDTGFTYACREDPSLPPGSKDYLPEHPQMECNDEPPGAFTGIAGVKYLTPSSPGTGSFSSGSLQWEWMSAGGLGIRLGGDLANSADPIQGSGIDHRMLAFDINVVWALGPEAAPKADLALGLTRIDWSPQNGSGQARDRFAKALLDHSWAPQLTISPRLAPQKKYALHPSVTLRYVIDSQEVQAIFGLGLRRRVKSRRSPGQWMERAQEMRNEAEATLVSTSDFVAAPHSFNAISSQSYMIRDCGGDAVKLMAEMRQECGSRCKDAERIFNEALDKLVTALDKLRRYTELNCQTQGGQEGCGAIAYCCREGSYPNYGHCNPFESPTVRFGCTDQLAECPRFDVTMDVVGFAVVCK